MAKKTTGKFFPKDYPNFKVVDKFHKKRSPRLRIFATGDPDEWFVDVLDVMKKTGEVVEEEGWITAKDVPSWTEWFNRLGWISVLTED